MFRFDTLWRLDPLQGLWALVICVCVLAVLALWLSPLTRWRGGIRWRRGLGWHSEAAHGPRRALWIGLLAPLWLAACANTSSLSVALQATQKFTIAEQSFDLAVKAADLVIDTGALPPATVTQIKTLGDQGYADVKVGRAAIVAADATSLAAETTALTALATQIAALAPAKTS